MDTLVQEAVELVAKGQDQVFATFGKITEQLKQIDAQASKGIDLGKIKPLTIPPVNLGKIKLPTIPPVSLPTKVIETFGGALAGLQAGFSKVQASLNGIASLGAKAFAIGTVSLAGMVAIADPVRFERMGYAFRDLAAVIGIMFAPVLDQITAAVYRFADAILNLDPATKEHIVTWTKWGVGIGGVLMILPKIVGVLGIVTGAVRGLGTAFGFLGAASGGILPALGIAIAAFAALYAGAKQSDTSVGGIMGTIRSVTDAIKPIIEGFTSLFKAIEPVFVEFGNIIKDTLVPILRTAGEVLGFLAGQLAEVLTYLRSIPVTLPGGSDTNSLSVGLRLLAGPLGWASLVKDMITGPTQGIRAMGSSRVSEPLKSSFGLGGGGKGSLGSLESGWQTAMMAGLRSPAAQTAENTEKAKEALNNILNTLNTFPEMYRQMFNRDAGDNGQGFEGAGADWS
jgi:hypothetical protein